MAPIFSIFKKNEMMFTSEVVRLPAQSIKLINQPTRADFVDLRILIIFVALFQTQEKNLLFIGGGSLQVVPLFIDPSAFYPQNSQNF